MIPRLYVYAGVAVALLATGFGGGWHFGSLHWRGKHDALLAQLTSESARITAESAAKAQKDRETYDANYTAISNKYHQELAAADAAADELTRRLREYSAHIHRLTVPKDPSGKTGTHEADADAAESAAIAAAVERVNGAVGEVAETGLKESGQLTALQQERASLH